MRMLLPALVLTACWASFGLAAENRPNIVILYADDMGYGDLGAHTDPARN